MTIEFSESSHNEFKYMDTAKATAWLRVAGVDDGLIWQQLNERRKVFVEAPAGTPITLIKKAIQVGCR